MASSSPERKTELKVKMRAILGDERYSEAMGIPLDALDSAKPATDKQHSKEEATAPTTPAETKVSKAMASVPGDDDEIAELQAKLQVCAFKPIPSFKQYDEGGYHPVHVQDKRKKKKTSHIEPKMNGHARAEAGKVEAGQPSAPSAAGKGKPAHASAQVKRKQKKGKR